MNHRALIAASLLTLSGCATCETHPTLCAVATAVAIGSVAAIAEHQHDQRSSSRGAPVATIQPVSCANPVMCQ